MYCITSPCPVLSVAQTQYDPLGLLYRRRKQPQRFQAQKPSQLGSSWFWRGFSIDPNDAYRVSTCTDGALPLPGRKASLQLGPRNTFHVHMCSVRVHNERGTRSRELGLWRDSACIGASLSSKRGRALGPLGTTRRMSVRTRAFNPQNGGPGRVILNLAGAGLLTYLTITGKLNWLFDAVLTIWLVSSVLWWFAERALIKGPCPNCGGEFQAFEFMLQDEYRFCPYCSQPFKLENKKFVRDEPQFSNQQTRGFKQPFGGFKGFGGFDDFDPPTSSRKREDSSGGVIVDVEAEVRDKD